MRRSNLAKCNAAMAIKGMALDAGFRADCLACVGPFPRCVFVTC